MGAVYTNLANTWAKAQKFAGHIFSSVNNLISLNTDSRLLYKQDGTLAMDWSGTIGFTHSPRIITMSSLGIVMNGNLADPTVGTDQTAQIEAAISFLITQYGITGFTLVIDGVVCAHDIKLRSGMTLQGLGWGTGIVLTVGGTCAVRNANWRSSYNAAGNSVGTNDPFLLVDQYSAIADHDICIRDMSINGNRDNASGNTLTTGSWLTNNNYIKCNTAGNMIVPIKLRGVRAATVTNVNVFNPPAFMLHCGCLDGATFRSIRVYDDLHAAAPANGPNTDGVHIAGPARNVTIDDVRGSTSDAFCAFLCEDWNLFSPANPSALKGAQLFDGYASVYHGDITDVHVTHVNGRLSQGGWQIMSLADRADRITFTGLHGLFSACAIQTQPDQITGYVNGSATGNIGQVTFEVIDAGMFNHTTGIACFNIGGRIETLILRSIRWPNLVGAWHSMWIQGNGTAGSTNIDQLIIDGFHINESHANTDTSGGAPNPIIVMLGAHIKNFQLRSVTWDRGTQSTLDAALVRIDDGTIDLLQMDDVAVDRAKYIINARSASDVGLGGAGAVLGEVQIRGLKHTNAGGNASIKLGINLPLLSVSQCSTAKLYDTSPTGGSITRAWDTSGSAYRNYVQNLSTVGYWRLGETSGTTAADLMGTSNGTYTNGVTLNKPGALTERDDRAASFAAASSQYVTIPHVTALTLGSNWSLSGWVKLASYTANEPVVLVKYGGGTNANYGLDMTATGQPRFTMTVGSVWKQYNASAAVPLNVWTHLVSTYDGAAAKVYVNGVLTVNQALTGTPDTNTNAPSIGRFGTAAQGYMDGLIDEVSLHSRTLTADEVAALYTLGSNKPV